MKDAKEIIAKLNESIMFYELVSRDETVSEDIRVAAYEVVKSALRFQIVMLGGKIEHEN